MEPEDLSIADQMPPLVLKIGGSLAKTGRARGVLDLVARSPRQIVVVPGGGVYADAVRADQATRGFSDAEAHRLAILAMHQMAADFQSLAPKLKAVESLKAMTNAWSEHRTSVWLPWTSWSKQALRRSRRSCRRGEQRGHCRPSPSSVDE